jgi:hypothetical protein
MPALVSNLGEAKPASFWLTAAGGGQSATVAALN